MKGKQVMKKKRLYAALLATVMVLTACGSEPVVKESQPEQTETSTTISSSEETVESQYPEYLNLEGPYPIVKDEYADDITLSAVIVMQDNAGDWEDLWINKYFQGKYNVNLDVEYLTYSNMDERTSLMLNSGELPDIMINLGITNAEIMKYGVSEGLFLQLDQYMDETLTPNILTYFEGKAAQDCTAPDGHVYTLPNMSEPQYSWNVKRLFINNKWLADLNLELPKTLDDFVDVMYKIKEADPAGVGSENLYPFGGGDKEGTGNAWYILNALGYLDSKTTNGDGYGVTPHLRDGEVVIPVYDMDVYQEYLKIMNQFYTDEIINPTFFTIEETEMNAQMVEGKTAMYHTAPYLSGITNQEDWVSVYPLTSAWQTEPEIGAYSYATPGNFLVSADTEYPELCLRFADLFYNNVTDYANAIQGSTCEPEHYYGMVHAHWDEEKNNTQINLPEGIASNWQYQVEYKIGNVWSFGAATTFEATEKMAEGFGHPEYVKEDNGQNKGNNIWANSVFTNMKPYADADGFPLNYYATEETINRILELETVIQPYATEQIALFITGRRPLSETEDFIKELEGLGIEDLLNIYKEVYADYNK